MIEVFGSVAPLSGDAMSWIGWGVFVAVVLLLLAADLGIFKKGDKEPTLKKALIAVGIRVGLAILFCVGIFFGLVGDYAETAAQKTASLEFLTAYLVEISLSVDNVFVFALVFKFFGVRPENQPRVLFWGILGAVLMRAVLIFAGIWLVNAFHFVIYLFGAVLIWAGIRMIAGDNEAIHPDQNPMVKLVRRFIPVTSEFRDHRFFVREQGRLWATPLFVVLVVIESTDLVFAIDSIPAVIAVTRDPFIVYTSNIFAILGLRALYFALAGVLKLFRFLHYGLSAILIFIGTKMLLADTPLQLRTEQSLAIVAMLLIGSIAASLMIPEKQKPTRELEPLEKDEKDEGSS